MAASHNFLHMRYYQGDDIKFAIDINQLSSSDIQDWTAFRSVIVYFYTSESYMAKFKNAQEDGYGMLTLSEDNKTYSGTLTQEHTIAMLGSMYMSIRVVDQEGNITTKGITTGISILPTPIKYEK